MTFPRVRAAVAAFFLIGLLGLGAACNKPSEQSCREALANMRRLLGTDTITRQEGSLSSEIRRCRGGSSVASVECARKATTLDELRACNLVKLPPAAAPAPATPPAK